MSREHQDTMLGLMEQIQRKAPEYVELLCSQTDEEFEAALDAMLERAVAHLEANSKNFASLDEVGLTAVLAGTLTMPGLSVTRETHCNGHVDITIQADHCTPMRRVLGEAKVYNGPKYHIDGLKQLLTRYTTGRDLRGLLITYVRTRDIAGLIAKVREAMDRDLPENQAGPTEDHRLRWSFQSGHKHSCGEVCRVGHIGCNLYREA